MYYYIKVHFNSDILYLDLYLYVTFDLCFSKTVFAITLIIPVKTMYEMYP